MLKVPIYLVDLDLTRPIVWNGSSLELSTVSFVDLEEKITKLRQERANAQVKIQKIRLDLGNIHKFDLFSLLNNIKLVERETSRLVSLLQYSELSYTNIQARISANQELITTVTALYEKYKDSDTQILKEIEDKKLAVRSIQAKIGLLDSILISSSSKSGQVNSRLRSCAIKSSGIAKSITALTNRLNLIEATNLNLYTIQANTQGYKTVIDTKNSKNQANLDYLASKICDLNIQFISLYNELTGIISTLSEAFSLTNFLSATIETSKLTLDKVSDNVIVLRDFYLEAERKLRAIENYLTAFIVGGDNVHLDFNIDYTIVHAVPPPIPVCPDPEPCPGSTPVIVSSTVPPTKTTKKPLDLGDPTTLKPKDPVILPPSDWCYPTDNKYLGCFVVYATVAFNPKYGQAVSFDGEWSDNEVLRVECYFDAESRVEAKFDAESAMTTWNKMYFDQIDTIVAFNSNPVIPSFKLIEVIDPAQCRKIFREDKL